jgi:hypothetical protein
MPSHTHPFLADCEAMADLYLWPLKENLKNWYPDIERNQWDALKFFLGWYAFERQGSSPDYPIIAAEVMDEMHKKPLAGGCAQAAWEAFKAKLNSNKLNYANNPLCPKGSTYQRRFKDKLINSVVSQYSVLEIIPKSSPDQSMVVWAKAHLQNDTLQVAHGELCRINGVNSKIASFFLRDIAELYHIYPKSQRALLQPVDIWVRYVANALSGKTLSDPECAQFFVDHAQRPERANQGSWFFCARIAFSSRFKVGKSIENKEYRKNLVRDHLRSAINYSQLGQIFAEQQEINLN